jgi:dihydroxy-acid dehydratase
LQSGDIIKIDIANYSLEVELSDNQIRERLAGLAEFEPRIKSGYLRRYAENVGPASSGAVFSR